MNSFLGYKTYSYDWLSQLFTCSVPMESMYFDMKGISVYAMISYRYGGPVDAILKRWHADFIPHITGVNITYGRCNDNSISPTVSITLSIPNVLWNDIPRIHQETFDKKFIEDFEDLKV